MLTSRLNLPIPGGWSKDSDQDNGMAIPGRQY
jgi:hypothetical protein